MLHLGHTYLLCFFPHLERRKQEVSPLRELGSVPETRFAYGHATYCLLYLTCRVRPLRREESTFVVGGGRGKTRSTEWELDCFGWIPERHGGDGEGNVGDIDQEVESLESEIRIISTPPSVSRDSLPLTFIVHGHVPVE